MAYLLSFLLRRLIQGVVIVLLAGLIVFCLLRIGPGSPARLIAGGMASEETVAQVSKDMGLGDPIVVQYFRYARTVLLHGDFGTSFVRPNRGPTRSPADAQTIQRARSALASST